MEIEPRSSAWDAGTLPVDDTRILSGLRRFYSRTVGRVTYGWQSNGVGQFDNARLSI